MTIAAAAAASRRRFFQCSPPRFPRRFHRSRKNPKPTPSQPPPTSNQVPQCSPPCTIAVESAPKSIPGTEPSSRRGADRRWAARRNEGNDPDRPLPARLRQCPMQTIHVQPPQGFKQFQIIIFSWAGEPKEHPVLLVDAMFRTAHCQPRCYSHNAVT